MALPKIEKKKDAGWKNEKAKNDVLFAVIEYGSKPIAYIVIGILVFILLLSIKAPLFKFLGQADEVRYGLFVYNRASQEGVSKELIKLSSLSNDQIQLFLIVGRKRPNHRVIYTGPEVSEENYRKLEEIGLLKITRIVNYPGSDKKDINWELTEQGSKLHSLLMKEVVKAIRKAETEVE